MRTWPKFSVNLRKYPDDINLDRDLGSRISTKISGTRIHPVADPYGKSLDYLANLWSPTNNSHVALKLALHWQGVSHTYQLTVRQTATTVNKSTIKIVPSQQSKVEFLNPQSKGHRKSLQSHREKALNQRWRRNFSRSKLGAAYSEHMSDTYPLDWGTPNVREERNLYVKY